jgi:hypothetical protein
MKNANHLKDMIIIIGINMKYIFVLYLKKTFKTNGKTQHQTKRHGTKNNRPKQ